MKSRTRLPLRVHLWPLLKIYTKFQPPLSIWKGYIGESAFFQVKNGETSSSFLLIDLDWWVKFLQFHLLRYLFLKVKKGNPPPRPHISSPNWLRRLIFGYVMLLWILYQLVQKRTFFYSLNSDSLYIWAWLSCDPIVVPTQTYLIHCQTEPIDRIGVILVRIKH